MYIVSAPGAERTAVTKHEGHARPGLALPWRRRARDGRSSMDAGSSSGAARARSKRAHDELIGEFGQSDVGDSDDESEEGADESSDACGPRLKVGDAVIAHHACHQFYGGRILGFDARRREFKLSWDDGDTSGTVQPCHLVYADVPPAAFEVGIGSIVLFPQGTYSHSDATDETERSGLLRYHEGRVTSIEATYPPTVTLYSGDHLYGEADSKWSTYAGHATSFRCELSELRARTNVYDLLLHLDSLNLATSQHTASAQPSELSSGIQMKSASPPPRGSNLSVSSPAPRHGLSSETAQQISGEAVSPTISLLRAAAAAHKAALPSPDATDVFMPQRDVGGDGGGSVHGSGGEGIGEAGSVGGEGGINEGAGPFDAYVSYAPCDAPAAAVLIRSLSRSGMVAVLGAASASSGGDEAERAVSQLRSSAVVIAVVTDGYAASEAAMHELLFAKKQLRKPVLPVRPVRRQEAPAEATTAGAVGIAVDGGGSGHDGVDVQSVVGMLLAEDEAFDVPLYDERSYATSDSPSNGVAPHAATYLTGEQLAPLLVRLRSLAGGHSASARRHGAKAARPVQQLPVQQLPRLR